MEPATALEIIFEELLRSLTTPVVLGVGAAEVVEALSISVGTPVSLLSVGSGGAVDSSSTLEVVVSDSLVGVDVSCVEVVAGCLLVVVAAFAFVGVVFGGSDVVVGTSCFCLIQTPLPPLS